MRPISEPELAASHAPQIVGRGEMAEAIRAFAWASTPLGPLSEWSETLVSTVNLILSLPSPCLLLVGPEMVMLYNDAFTPTLTDRHPALARRGRQFWTDAWPHVGEQLEAVLRSGTTFVFEKAFVPILRNGVLTDTYWDYTYAPVIDPTAQVCGILVLCQDVTSSVMAEQDRTTALQALRERQQQLDRTVEALRIERSRLFSILHQAPIFFALLHGPDHVFSIANPPYMTLIGGRDVLGKPLAVALPEIVSQGYVEMVSGVYSTGEPVILHGAPVEILRTPGQPAETRYVDFTYQALREADNSISGVMVLGVDITEKKRSEQALLQNEKLAAVGRLASTIAHEINNPLESVTNLVYLARQGAEGPALEYLDLADLELRRMSAITHQTLSFNKHSAARRATSARDLCSGVANIYQSRITNAGIRFERRERARNPVVCLDGEIRQVLNNLVANAIDAMPHGGRLLLRSRDAVHPTTGEPGLVITVADTGTGIAPESMRSIFEPFYTTKDLGGTGLGLWISRDIATRHRGELRVRSSVSPGSQGTVFTLFLPSYPPEPATR